MSYFVETSPQACTTPSSSLTVVTAFSLRHPASATRRCASSQTCPPGVERSPFTGAGARGRALYVAGRCPFADAADREHVAPGIREHVAQSRAQLRQLVRHVAERRDM